jgi:putative ABC transport system ATP-binding protein
VIKISNVSKSYTSGLTVVKAINNVSLDIEMGQFISIAGPSGSGKSTLLNLIGCIDSVDSGNIEIEKVDVSSLDEKQRTTFRRNHLGFIFQTYNLIPVLTAYENVSFALSLISDDQNQIKEQSYQILKEVGLENLESRFPNQLSGGEQQRVAIARALVKNPKIILADEPTANLDSKTGKGILELMKKINQKYKTTFIFSTHDNMVMEQAERLVMLHDGMVVSDEKN